MLIDSVLRDSECLDRYARRHCSRGPAATPSTPSSSRGCSSRAGGSTTCRYPGPFTASSPPGWMPWRPRRNGCCRTHRCWGRCSGWIRSSRSEGTTGVDRGASPRTGPQGVRHAGRGGPRSPTRRSSRSPTRWSGTSRTGRFPGATGRASTSRSARWLEELSPDRVEDRAEMLAHHYMSALELVGRVGRGHLRTSRARPSLADAGGGPSVVAERTPGGRAVLRGGIRLSTEHDVDRPDCCFATGRSRPDDSAMDDALLVEAAESFADRGDREGAAEAEVMLAFIWWVRGSRHRMAEHLDRARSLVEEEPASPAKARVLSDLARSRMLAGEYHDARSRSDARRWPWPRHWT